MSNHTLNSVAMFTVGGLVGSAVTWYLLKTKYERLAQEEIDSVKEALSRTYNYDEPVEVSTDNKIEEETQFTEKDIREYKDTVQKMNYSACNTNQKPAKEVEKVINRPYIIEPGEFDTLDDYAARTLTYYANGVLTDEYDEVIEDAEDLIGIDPEEHFGEYERDSIFVRDDRARVDYEILRDYGIYREDE